MASRLTWTAQIVIDSRKLVDIGSKMALGLGSVVTALISMGSVEEPS